MEERVGASAGGGSNLVMRHAVIKLKVAAGYRGVSKSELFEAFERQLLPKLKGVSCSPRCVSTYPWPAPIAMRAHPRGPALAFTQALTLPRPNET